MGNSEIKPVVVDHAVAVHIACELYGRRYGIDWIWHHDGIGLLHPQSTIDRLTADAASLRERMVEVERHLDDYVIREWRAERAKRKVCEERDAAVADAEWYRWLLKRISDRKIGANVCDSVGFKNKEQTNG